MKRKLNIYILFAIVFLQGFVFYGPVATLYRQARGLTMSDIFLIESVSWILMIVLEVPWGWFADRFGYKKTLVIANFIFFLSKIVFYEAHSFELFLFERVLISLAIAGITGCDIALMYASVDELDATKVFGRYDAFAHGGFLLAALSSSWIVAQSMDNTALYTIFPYGLAAILALFLQDVEVQNRQKPKLRNSIRAALHNKSVIILVLAVALVREVAQAVTTFLNQPQYLRSGIEIQYFGVLVAVLQIVRLSSAKAHSLSDRFGKRWTMQSLFALSMACCILLAFTTNPVVSVLMVILLGGAVAVLNPIALDIQNQAIEVADRATILSVYAMVGDLVSALINPVIGKSADISIQAAFGTCAVICLIACGLLFRLRLSGLLRNNERGS